MSKPVFIQAVPTTTCYRSPQIDWPLLASLLSVDDEPAGYNFGSATPASGDRDKGWFRTNADGTPIGWYAYAGGQWLRRVNLPAPGTIVLWDGLETDIPLLDGGEAGAITTTTGAYWERVTAMDARFPLGVGTYGATTVAVGDTGGAHEVALDLEQIPSHDHGIAGKKLVHQVTPSGVLQQTSGNDLTTSTFQASGGKSDGSTKAHNNMPPYRGMFYLKRTARLYDRAP